MITPNSEQIMVAWLKTVTSLAALVGSQVATTLPASGTLTKPVFLQVMTSTGNTDRVEPARNPIIRLDAWAAPRLRGEVLAALDLVRDATYEFEPVLVSVRTGMYLAKLADVSIFGEPRFVPNDPAQLAHATCDLEMTYVVLR